MATEPEQILRLVLFGIMHWLLAFMMLSDLANRRRVLGKHKLPWVIAIVFVAFIGSVIYLLCHPQIISGGDRRDEP